MAQIKQYKMNLLDKGILFVEQTIKQQHYVSHKSFDKFEQEEIRKESKRRKKS
jgi:hypothetical protein